MPGNLRKRLNGKAGRTERDYLRARRRVLQQSQICSECAQAIDLQLKPVCQFVKTDLFTVETAHLIPLECGEGCREAKHARKPNPWSASADHKIPVAELPPDSPLLTSSKNLVACHLVCNQRKGNRKNVKPRHKTSRDWFA
ncbi:hypothetical protein UPIE_97 [Mycobacterium phage UPIE]|uniref:HNH endonuclease n=1 Tax=Mycobacterium phage UPIE TaxID=1034147 RepID=G1BS23_9CAUD|nr:hypothetical protein UPIE_97 [Mycobacterium phage UPIE]AEZ50775.1 hypothetical protein [Mycobacterium phage Fezzik]AZS12252.1 HNH endonuclease [Mycobacterium phage Acquire49]QGJ92501.1 HNH endonuclease [Mycobacterium phage Wyatt2]